ncbi:MAG TPA: VanW family protein [Gaiellaceae bacterium]|nr:VanW family protein [Gaiellaceae bacterium]
MRPLVRNLVLFLLALVAAGFALGFAFAGSPSTIANGVRVDGVDVGGMDADAALALLERRSDARQQQPVVFAAGDATIRIAPATLGVRPDWQAAIDAAQRQGGGFGPLRGFRRIDVQFFGADVTPPVGVLRGALGYELRLIAKKVNRKPQEAAVVRHGLTIDVVPGRPGVVLDTKAAADTIVHALASLDAPAGPVALPLRRTAPSVRPAALARAARRARLAVSAPVQLVLGKTHWLLRPARLATLLQFPSGGDTTLRVGGPAAEQWLDRFAARVEHPAKDATFAVHGDRVAVVPARDGVALDAAGTADAILAAATRRTNRVAQVAVESSPPEVTTAAAERMGIRRPVASYTTEYGGIPNRIHNVQLVAHLVDDTLIGPGDVFSFNGTTGARTAAKGFREAPVIVNGELTTGLGGGVCQVSTTVFNAAFEGGLPILTRTNHALYISHYPQGRDATVNYPDVDLKFRNDTGHWLLLRTFVGSYSLTVTLYGTPTGRKVESTTAPLVAHGTPPLHKTVDKTLKPGEKVVDDPGVPRLTTSVTRKVYSASGKLLDDDVFYSSYVASPKLVRIGPAKKKAQEKVKHAPRA